MYNNQEKVKNREEKIKPKRYLTIQIKMVVLNRR